MVSKPIMLTDKMREVMRTMHRSYRTEETYIHWVKRFIRFHKGRDPRKMRENEIRMFLSYLAADQNVAANTQDLAKYALLFLYKYVLGIELGPLGKIYQPTKPKRIPTVFTHEEAMAIINQLDGRIALQPCFWKKDMIFALFKNF